jgi:hypothetical protein
LCNDFAFTVTPVLLSSKTKDIRIEIFAVV